MGFETQSGLPGKPQFGWDSPATQDAVERAKKATIRKIGKGELKLSLGQGGGERVVSYSSGIKVGLPLEDVAKIAPGRDGSLSVGRMHLMSQWLRAFNLYDLSFDSDSESVRVIKNFRSSVTLGGFRPAVDVMVGASDYHHGGVKLPDGYWFLNSARRVIGGLMLFYEGEDFGAVRDRGFLVVQQGEDNKTVAAFPDYMGRLWPVPFAEQTGPGLKRMFEEGGALAAWNPVIGVCDPEFKT